MPPDDIDVFARLLRAIEPYLDDVVLVGGWVHTLYLGELGPAPRSVRTTDVDISVPRQLPTHDRPALLELVKEAGFEIEQIAADSGLVLIRKGDVDLDILCDAESPSEIIPIEGQGGLSVQGYPYLNMLLDASRSVTVGPDLHQSLDPPVTVRIPTLPAYALGKILSAQGRRISRRRTKDGVSVSGGDATKTEKCSHRQPPGPRKKPPGGVRRGGRGFGELDGSDDRPSGRGRTDSGVGYAAPGAGCACQLEGADATTLR